MVQRQWKARLGLALGIAGSGVGLGIFLVVPLCQALIDGFGWRWAFRALAILCALWILPATYLAIRDTPPSPREPAARGEAARPPTGEHSLGLALANPSFRLIGLAVFLGSICSQTLHVHQAAFLVGSRPAGHDRRLGDQRGGRLQHRGQDGRGLDLGSSLARAGLRARHDRHDRRRGRALAGGAGPVGVARARLRGAVRRRATRSPRSSCPP